MINKKELIKFYKGDKEGSIDELIGILNDAKENGATNYTMVWSQDPNWAYKWFELYRIKSDAEIKQEEILNLEKKLSDLKMKNA